MSDDNVPDVVEENENAPRDEEEDENDTDMNEEEPVFDDAIDTSDALRRPEPRPSPGPLLGESSKVESKPVVPLPPPVQLPSKTRLKIQIKALHPVAEWKWTDGGDDSCGICQMPFEVCCVACKAPGDGCPLVVGVCRHPFHLHCISKWTAAQTTPRPQCPMCRQEWKPKPKKEK